MRAENLAEMNAEATRFAATLEPKDVAVVVALSGELGAGKTTFAQALAKALGVEESVTSPTFVIEKIYALSGKKFSRLVHIDAYRLNGAHELQVLGWDALLRDPQNLIVIEWPEKVEGAIPADALMLSFAGSGEGRDISYGKKEN
jgi:tRNA threonylcarbamoyladenosine biosynthesis protein TsaE